MAKNIIPMPAKPDRPTRTRFRLFERYEENKKNPDEARKRFLRFDVNALADFEQETGMGYQQLIMQKATFAAARALTWAGLKQEDRVLTLEDVGRLISKWLTDESPEAVAEQRNINSILMVVLQAGVEQGAFGRVKPPEDPDDAPDAEEARLIEAEVEKADEKDKEKSDPNAQAVEGQVIPS